MSIESAKFVKPTRPLVLCILDGVGLRDDDDPSHGNAVAAADSEFYQSLFTRYPWTRLGCMGLEVGLPEGQMGNSEVGHLAIGSGRVIDQDLNRIARSIATNEFRERKPWRDLCDALLKSGGALHLLGLVSPGGVHSHTDHLYGIIAAARDAGITRIFVHVLLDGRDTDPESGLGNVQTLQSEMDGLGAGRIASVGGRYYGMDRDKRWDRVEKAWQAIVLGRGETGRDAVEIIAKSYAAGVTDEFVIPCVVTDEAGAPLGTVADGDGVFFWNFRSDRARELTWAFNQPEFDGFKRVRSPKVSYLCMTTYDAKMGLPVLFGPETPQHILADVFAEAGITNLRTAETEKYAHVTYFFNGGREEPFPGEDRLLVPSPKVATYDLQPEMSAPQVADGVLKALDAGRHDVIIVNFANGDMVGHTGVLAAATRAFTVLNGLLEQIVGKVLELDGVLLLTADHGNCEEMISKEGRVLTNHSLNDVPFVVIGRRWDGLTNVLIPGRHSLSDIAPTMLHLLGLQQPEEMSGKPLLMD